MFVHLKVPRVFGMPGNANLSKEYLAADIAGRAIYAIGGLLGNLWRDSKERSGFYACHPDTKTWTVQWIRDNSGGPRRIPRDFDLGRLTAHDQVQLAGDDWAGELTFFKSDWIRRSWGRYFDVVDIKPRAEEYQTAVVLAKKP